MSCTSCGAALPDGARFCPACGTAVEAPPATVGGERKLATVLFADLVGSTALASDADPERVRMQLDRFYTAMADEIERTGGTVEAFAGDAVMAVFGAPAALEDHAERALHAGLAMQRRVAAELPGLGLRIGVNTGEVVVGASRHGTSFATGDTVNVCKRLEQAAGAGEVLAGERTVAAAQGAFEFSGPRHVEGKGKPGGIDCRAVLRAVTLVRPRGLGGTRRAFVGRDSELELLRATYRRAVAGGGPHVVTIVGEPGVGKTRLVDELWAALADEAAAPVRRAGRCPPFGDGVTYWPIGELLRDELELGESAPADEALARLEGREILGLALGLDVAVGVHPVDARERLHEAIVAFVERLAAERPAAVLVEDVHWAEADLLDLLDRVAAEARAPILLVTTTRPELFDRRPGWGAGRRNAGVIWLDPLGADDVGLMLDEIAPTLPLALRAQVVERAGGNPFFLEELVGALVDAGVLEPQGTTWAAVPDHADYAMPDTVHAVLAARIDRLPRAEKAALQAAAVVGRVFWESSVLHLLDGATADFRLLQERDLIRRHRRSAIADEREHEFKHALTREVAYASIPKARRGRLHATLARWLEDVRLAADELAPLLAYHYYEAVRPEDADLMRADGPDEHERLRKQAVRWLRRAAELAHGRHELDEAVELLSRAIELEDAPHERALLWRRIGEAHALRYDGDRMRAALLEALAGPLDDHERADTLAYLAFQASIRSAMWSIRLNRDLIVDWAEQALDLAAADSDARPRALLALANVDPLESAGVLHEATALAEARGDTALRAYAFGARCSAAFERGELDDAAHWSERRLALLPEIDDPDHRCEAYENAVPVAVAAGRFDEARRMAELHWRLAGRLSPHHRVHAVSLELETAEAAGDWTSIAERTGRVSELVSANLSTPCVRNPRDLLLCGLAHLCLGDEPRWDELQRDASRIAGEGYDSYLSGPRLRTALVRGDRAAVEHLLGFPLERIFVWGAGVLATRLDALVATRRHDAIEAEAPRLVQPGTLVEPFALRALGAARRDDDLFARADDAFAALGLDWHRAQTDALLRGL